MEQNLTQQIKAEALRLGFSACGIAKAEPVDEHTAERFSKWIASNKCASMDYMRNHMEKRLNPCLLMPEAKSIITVALNYYPARLLRTDQYQFAYYAYGKDYHDVMRSMMTSLADRLKTLFSATVSDVCQGHGEDEGCDKENPSEGIKCKLCCDTVPILDRYWAWRSGIGWIGKNTNLIIPRCGSYFFLGEIIIDKELDYDSPMEPMCGNCTRCLEACPKNALEQPYLLNAGKCLSYLSIECRDSDVCLQQDGGKSEGQDSQPTYIYGCDRCQQACPHNRYAVPTAIKEFTPSDDLLAMTKEDWHGLTLEHYRMLFKGSAVKRAKYDGLMRNIRKLKNERMKQ